MSGFGATGKKRQPKNHKADQHKLLEQAVKLHKQGDNDAAELLYLKAIDCGLRHEVAFSNLGVIYKRTNRTDKAIEIYQRAIATNPLFADAYANLGNLLLERNQFEEALEVTLKAIELDPDHSTAHSNLSTILKSHGKLDEAFASAIQAARVSPEQASPYLCMAAILENKGELEQAISAYSKAIELKPDCTAAYLGLALVLQKQGDLEGAVHAALKAQNLDPEKSTPYAMLGSLLKECGQLEQALAATQKAISIKPDYAEAIQNLGNIYAEFGKYDEAELYATKALEIDRGLSIARVNLGLYQLLKQDYSLGWANYGARIDKKFTTLGNYGLGASFDLQQWDGTSNRIVLVTSEQGLGDQILFASMIKELQSICKEVILQVDKRLIGLFNRSLTGNIRILSYMQEADIARCDYQISIGDLGRFLRWTTQDFDSTPTAYLQADHNQTQHIKTQLRGDTGSRICGLSWRSVGTRYFNTKKNIDLSELIKPLHCSDLIFVSLQYGNVKEEIHTLNESQTARINELKDIDNTLNIDGLASLISACDIVITISNITAHLAGALGKETHLLVPASPHWYWGLGSSKTNWYPSIRVHRQSIRGCWTDVVNGIASSILA